MAEVGRSQRVEEDVEAAPPRLERSPQRRRVGRRRALDQQVVSGRIPREASVVAASPRRPRRRHRHRRRRPRRRRRRPGRTIAAAGEGRRGRRCRGRRRWRRRRAGRRRARRRRRGRRGRRGRRRGPISSRSLLSCASSISGAVPLSPLEFERPASDDADEQPPRRHRRRRRLARRRARAHLLTAAKGLERDVGAGEAAAPRGGAVRGRRRRWRAPTSAEDAVNSAPAREAHPLVRRRPPREARIWRLAVLGRRSPEAAFVGGDDVVATTSGRRTTARRPPPAPPGAGHAAAARRRRTAGGGMAALQEERRLRREAERRERRARFRERFGALSGAPPWSLFASQNRSRYSAGGGSIAAAGVGPSARAARAASVAGGGPSGGSARRTTSRREAAGVSMWSWSVTSRVVHGPRRREGRARAPPPPRVLAQLARRRLLLLDLAPKCRRRAPAPLRRRRCRRRCRPGAASTRARRRLRAAAPSAGRPASRCPRPIQRLRRRGAGLVAHPQPPVRPVGGGAERRVVAAVGTRQSEARSSSAVVERRLGGRVRVGDVVGTSASSPPPGRR